MINTSLTLARLKSCAQNNRVLSFNHSYNVYREGQIEGAQIGIERWLLVSESVVNSINWPLNRFIEACRWIRKRPNTYNEILCPKSDSPRSLNIQSTLFCRLEEHGIPVIAGWWIKQLSAWCLPCRGFHSVSSLRYSSTQHEIKMDAVCSVKKYGLNMLGAYGPAMFS